MHNKAWFTERRLRQQRAAIRQILAYLEASAHPFSRVAHRHLPPQEYVALCPSNTVHLDLGPLSGRALHNYVGRQLTAKCQKVVRASVFELHRLGGEYTAKSAVTEANDGQYASS
ncbi:uncharacterized protein LACBIDRAFT_321122 [Laccaria bicolor S238N-H82]|uniref:Predicted protein n=1 Tax=Laccaria bicolor (strain S238N-H82 / ATCC MYA-4686) TaxID=486041 RepID=B0CNU5_LACBS|nr:uncharacterized protein LACBIDRAFT_321122 [Laccaria bicolor S238N-H82]EDR16002.1 predicted protein [Laccaria bicolor S238N-H82]|eukprot:XP_001874210.1 predicted protein [Laccaria bicolor S238N-H82]